MNRLENTFAQKPENYAQFRPTYPKALYEWLMTQCENRKYAWDCATGNGQSAIELSSYFKTIYATDISEHQIRYAHQKSNIFYSVQSAEATAFSDQSFNLITVAQALHWFDYSAFWPEVKRVAQKDAFFCAWGYDWPTVTPELDAQFIKPFRDMIAPFWPAQSKILWNGYIDSDIAFPFGKISASNFAIELQWTLDLLIEYMMTWSAYKRSQASESVKLSLAILIGEARTKFALDQHLSVVMPLKVVAGRVRG